MPHTKYIWDPLSDNVLMEKDESGDTRATNTYLPELYGDLISQHRDGETHFDHYDGEGNTRALTDINGNVTDRYTYNASGDVISHTGNTTNPFGYKGALGYYANPETNDYYVRARTYEPRIGRWMSVDPIGALDRMNLYVYVVNNPVNRADPSGEVDDAMDQPWKKPLPATKPGTCNAPIRLFRGDPIDFAFSYWYQEKVLKSLKCRLKAKHGTAEIKFPTIPRKQTKFVTNPNAVFCGRPGRNQYFGPDGMKESVGILLIIPDDGGFSVLMAHASGDVQFARLLDYKFPAGTRGIICGGDNTPESNVTFSSAIGLFNSTNVTLDGIVDAEGCYVDSDGNYRLREGTPLPKPNDPPCDAKDPLASAAEKGRKLMQHVGKLKRCRRATRPGGT